MFALNCKIALFMVCVGKLRISPVLLTTQPEERGLRAKAAVRMISTRWVKESTGEGNKSLTGLPLINVAWWKGDESTWSYFHLEKKTWRARVEKFNNYRVVISHQKRVNDG